MITRKRVNIFNKIKSTMKVKEIVASGYTIIIYRPRKTKGGHKQWPRTKAK
jgi:RNA-binding protein YhbY